jgi:hypothetical protein
MRRPDAQEFSSGISKNYQVMWATKVARQEHVENVTESKPWPLHQGNKFSKKRGETRNRVSVAACGASHSGDPSVIWKLLSKKKAS